ncbi:hypothetical protein G7046_g757 [Stylonectria norvegica]|nr:hypothetical protein G7046_g757 [Stylonectria norvegica]
MGILSLLSLAAVAVASPLTRYVNAINDRSISVSSGDLNNFKFYVQHSAAAYCNVNTAAGKVITCGSSACPGVTAVPIPASAATCPSTTLARKLLSPSEAAATSATGSPTSTSPGPAVASSPSAKSTRAF